MTRQGLYLGVLLSVIVVSLTIIPAYAEVTSLKTNTSFYKGGSKIYFSGTVLDTDPPNVTLLLFDPTDKFISLASGMADSNHTFQIIVDTSTSDNQQKFALKGTYNATAFIATKENGKTVAFTFSPDGSPVIPSPPTSLTLYVASSSQINLSWSASSDNGGSTITGYMIERSQNNGNTWSTIIQNTGSTSTTYSDTGLAASTAYSYRVSAVNSAGPGSPSNVVTTITSSPPAQTTPNSGSTTDQSQTSVDDLIKKRIEDAKRLQDLLNSKNSGSPSTVNSKVIQLSEKMAVDDVASNPGVQKSNTLGNNLMPGLGGFNVNTVIYPIISLVGAGIVVSILYLRKKRSQSDNSTDMTQETHVPEVTTEQKDDGDNAMTILKNRLAKGEITVDEFKELKEELSEP